MASPQKNLIRYTKSPIAKKIKMDGRTVVSEAFVKPGVSNLIPKLHVKRGDTVMLISGSDKTGKGKTGKVLTVFPSEGKIVVEGINMITRASKQRSLQSTGGLIKKEGPIFASRVMLYCTACKKTTRIRHKQAEGAKKTRICIHCQQAFDA